MRKNRLRSADGWTHWQELAHVTALIGIGLVAPVFQVIFEAPDFFVAHRAEVVDFIGIAIFCLILQPCALVFPIFLTRALSPRLARIGFYSVLLLLFALTVLVILNRFVIFEQFGALVAVIVAVLALRLYQDLKSFRSLLTLLSPAVVLMPVIFALVFLPIGRVEGTAGRMLARPINAHHPATIVILLDELPMVALLTPAGSVNSEAFPNFYRLQQRAHWFRNTTTVAGYTHIAIPAILTGMVPTFERRKFPRFLDYPINLFTLARDSYAVTAFEQVTQLCPPALCEKRAYEESRGERMVRLLLEVFDLELRIALPSSSYLQVSNVIGALKYRVASSISEHADKIVMNEDTRGFVHVPEWEDDKKLFMTLIGSLRPGAEAQLYFLHVTFPHVPYEYFPSGRSYFSDTSMLSVTSFVETMPSDPGLALVYQQRFLAQLQFTDRLLGVLLDKLDGLGLLKESLLVVSADHGTSFEPGNPTRSFTTDNAAQLALVPLFIKLPGQSQPVLHEEPVQTIDILPTLLHQMGIQSVTPMDGHDLFGNVALPPERKFFSLNMAYTANAETLASAYDIRRFSSLQADRFGEELESLYDFGLHPELVDRPLDEVRRLEEPHFEIQIRSPARLEHVSKARGAKVPGLIHGDIVGPSDATGRLEVALVLNGKVRGMALSTPLRGGRAEFEGLVADTGFKEGKNSFQGIPVGIAGDRDLARIFGGKPSAAAAGVSK